MLWNLNLDLLKYVMRPLQNGYLASGQLTTPSAKAIFKNKKIVLQHSRNVINIFLE